MMFDDLQLNAFLRRSVCQFFARLSSGGKNNGYMVKVDKAITRYQLHVLVLEDSLHKESRRSLRIRALMKRIIALATKRGVKVEVLRRHEVRAAFFSEGLGD
jgi:hypothetical protein